MWKSWDNIRNDIWKLYSRIEQRRNKIEEKISYKLLYSEKTQMGCFHKYPVANVFDYPKTDFIYRESEEKCAYKVVTKPRSAPDFMEEKEDVDYFPDYIAVLNNAEVIPCTDVVIKDGVMLSDRFEYDKQFRSTLLMPRVVYDKKSIVLKTKRKECLKGEYINLCFAGTGNIWHITHWMISKMRLINSCDALKNVPILMDECIKTSKFARQFFACFNWDHHKIVYLNKNRLYQVERVYMTSASGVCVRLEQNNFVSICSRKFAPYVRSVMLKKLRATSQKRKFFIRRGDGRLVNEEEVMAYLKSKGFEVIQPEKYSFIDELSLFYNAECVVGATGAGFTNILYMQNECSVICIASEERIDNVTSLATDVQDIGVKVYYCPARAVSKDGVVLPMKFRVSIPELEKIHDHIYPDPV